MHINTNHPSVDAGQDNPADLLAILLPSLSILQRAALLISPAAMNEQNGHEDGVGPWQEVLEAAGSAHRVRQDQITKVVDVSGISPPARAQQNAVMLESILGAILDMYNLRFLAPKHAISLGATDEILLVIDRAEQNISSNTGACQENGPEVGENDWVDCQVLGLKSVNTWEPDNGSPSEVEAKVVMANIDSAKVPILVDEEVDDVDGVKQCGQKN